MKVKYTFTRGELFNLLNRLLQDRQELKGSLMLRDFSPEIEPFLAYELERIDLDRQIWEPMATPSKKSTFPLLIAFKQFEPIEGER